MYETFTWSNWRAFRNLGFNRQSVAEVHTERVYGEAQE